MSTRTTLHRLALASTVAAMLASAAPSVFAQTTDTPAPPATTTPDATAPMSGSTSSTPMSGGTSSMPMSGSTSSTPMSGGTSSMPMSGSTSSMPMSGMSSPNVPAPPMNLPTDYKILDNRVFDGTDLEQARARGLSDNQIATVIKISKETGLSFNEIVAMVERGETFPAIATTYNLKISSVYNNDKEKQEISDYDALNKYAKSLGKSDSMMSMPMSSGSSSMTPPMTPSTPPMTPTDTTTSMSPGTSQLDIVETAMAARNLTTLVKALQIAGLTETLKGAGPFTVFAPDDRAFARLPAGALDALEADPARLRAVLTYHVIPANIMAADAMAMTSPTSPPTVEGATLQVTKRRGHLRVNDATVTKADIKASNGTIHIINMVLMPPTTDTTATPPTTDTTTPPAAPMNATPPAAPATPGTTDATPGTTPVTPGTTDSTSGTTSGMSGTTPGTSGAAPATPDATPGTPPAAPATPGQ